MRAAAAALLCVLAGGVQAHERATSAIELAPTRLSLKPGQAGLFYVANEGASRVTVQIEPFDWRQANGADVLSASDTLLVSPPFVTLEPGARQTVRVLADAADGAREAQYRLLVSELPPADAPQTGVRVLLQFSVPVFVSGGGVADIAWEATAAKGVIRLVATNRGGRTVNLDAVTLWRGELRVASEGGLAYVLPGSSRSWTLPAAGGAPLHVVAHDALSGTDFAADIAPHR